MRLPNFGPQYDQRAVNEMARLITVQFDLLDAERAKQPAVISAVSGDTTPDVSNFPVAGVGILKIPAASVYTVTNFIGGREAQHIVVINTGSQIVTINRDNAKLAGGANQALSPDHSLQLLRLGALWYQVGATVAAS